MLFYLPDGIEEANIPGLSEVLQYLDIATMAVAMSSEYDANNAASVRSMQHLMYLLATKIEKLGFWGTMTAIQNMDYPTFATHLRTQAEIYQGIYARSIPEYLALKEHDAL